MLLNIDLHAKIQRFTGIFFLVLVDGVDVTNRCVSADAEAGWALCYRLNADGHKFVENDRVAIEVLEGRIEFIRRADAPVDLCAQARCAYCGRFGPLGQCEGCGAPNVPVPVQPQIEVTTFGDRKRRFVPAYPSPEQTPNEKIYEGPKWLSRWIR